MNRPSDAVNPHAERLLRARAQMREARVDAWLVPSSDPHLSEYLPAHWQGRQWLSGFTGSAGTLVVTERFAGLWADSRYWQQAEQELAGTGIELVKWGPGQPGPLEWLAQTVQPGEVVAVDGQVLGLAQGQTLARQLQAGKAHLRTDLDLFDGLWLDRPALPAKRLYAHLPPEAVGNRREKLQRVRDAMAGQGADWHFIASLDDIAWLLDLRGADVPYNPVFLSFVLLGPQQASLFVAGHKVESALREELARDGIRLREYAEVAAALAAIEAPARVLVDPARVTWGLLQALDGSVERLEAINPSTLFKAQKSAAEVAHVRQAMEQDGAALCEFFAWLEEALARGEAVTELDIAQHLQQARQRRPGHVGASFATIAAFQANGAMPHYKASEQSFAHIEGNGLLLIDSGAQYLGGTTDITRMVPIGTLEPEQKADCSRVLKGLIALSRARFPRGIAAPLLDAIARAPLWAEAVDYGHGTGHGVGYFLNVHEGPQSIAYRAQVSPHAAMQPGMITSIEPGTYRPGRWGVRIENLVVNREAASSEFGEFLAFETLTLCPIDTRCLALERLDAAERAWLDGYHRQVRKRLQPLLKGAALDWLLARTEPLSASHQAG